MSDDRQTAVENADKLLVGNPASEMPEVELQAVTTEAHEIKTEKTAENQQKTTTSKAVLVDSQGRTFDPLLHETEDGTTPLLRADGKTIKCRRIPLKELKTASRVHIEQKEPTADTDNKKPELDEEKIEMQRKAGAMTLAGIQIFIMRKSLGQHIAAKETDQKALAECWDDMFSHYGVSRMHPVLGLAVITGMITFEGMQQEETRNALSKAWLWLRLKIGAIWLRATEKKGDKQAEKSKDDSKQ